MIGKKALVVFFSKVDRVLHDALGVKPQHRHRRRVLEFHHDAFGLRSDPQTRSGPPPSYCHYLSNEGSTLLSFFTCFATRVL